MSARINLGSCSGADLPVRPQQLRNAETGLRVPAGVVTITSIVMFLSELPKLAFDPTDRLRRRFAMKFRVMSLVGLLLAGTVVTLPALAQEPTPASAPATAQEVVKRSRPVATPSGHAIGGP